MGVDPLTLGVIGAGAGSLWGAANQTSANRANSRSQRQALAAQAHQQAIINAAVQSMMQQGQNPFSQMLMSRLNGGQGEFTAPTNLTAPNISSDFVTGSQGFNAGQDALMQLIRGGGQPFDTSKQFAALEPLDQRLINSQVAGLRGRSTSLGQRFGTATLGAERLLRGNFAQDIAARNAGIQSSAYESAQGRNISAAGQLQQGGLNQASLLAQIAQANAGNQLQTGQFNSAQNQAWNQFISGVIGQAGGFQQNQQNQNAQLLAIMAGLPQQGFATQQPSALPGAIGDISQLLMFLPFLKGLQGGGQQTTQASPWGSVGLQMRGYS